MFLLVFFFNDTATTEIYTLSLHDALPICFSVMTVVVCVEAYVYYGLLYLGNNPFVETQVVRLPYLLPFVWLIFRSEEHTSELQSRQYLVCRLLLEKKKILILYIYQLTLRA